MIDYYFYIKALHLIFVITWFAGLFYIPRLFVYQIEANEKPEPDRSILVKQLQLMTKRLWYIITWPSAILTAIFAIWLLFLNPSLLHFNWMHLKLVFVGVLYGYHIKCQFIFIEMQANVIKWSSNSMRLWNEVSTIILFAVIFLVILRDAFNWIYGVIGIILLSVILMLGVKIYKRIRSKDPNA